MNGSFLVDSDDIGEIEAALMANYGRIRMAPLCRTVPTRTRIWRTHLGTLNIDETELGTDVSYEAAPPDDILLCRILSGAIEEKLPHRNAEVYGPGAVVAFGALEGVPYTGHARRLRCEIIAIDRTLLSDVAAEQGSGERARVRLTSSAPVSPAANQLVVDAIDYVRHGVIANPHALAQPLMAASVTRYLAATLLTSFPHVTDVGPAIADERDASQQLLLRRALAFIDENAHGVLSLADVATAVNVTPRALQAMFQRHRDCTPMEYVRQVRLHHAHLDLEAGQPETTSVTDVARRWGFGNAGRFSSVYRSAYGRSPQLTLGRRA